MARARHRNRTPEPEAEHGVPVRTAAGLPAWMPVVVVLVAVAVFAPVLFCGFTNWDDPVNVTENRALNPPTLAGLGYLWTHPYHHMYIPLVYTSYALDMVVGRGAPVAFHATNLVLHAVSSLLVLFLLHMLLCAPPVRRDGCAPGCHLAAVMCGTLLFAIHPLQVEPVAWVTGRKDVLSGCLLLLSALFHVRLRMLAAAGQGRVVIGSVYMLTISFAAFVLALLAKPGGLTLPLGLLAIDRLVFRVRLRTSLATLLPMLAAAGVCAVMTMGAQAVPGIVTDAMPFWKRPLIVGDAAAFYLRKVVFPAGLAPVYGRTPVAVLASPYASLWCLAALAVLVAAAWAGRLIAAAMLFSVAMLLPVLGIVPFLFQNYSTVADRYMYLPMVGVALACAAGVRLVCDRWPGGRRALAVGAAAILGLLAWRSIVQCGHWRDSVTLWRHSIAVAPEVPESHHNLGEAYRNSGRVVEAEERLREAVRLNGDFGEAWNSLGLMKLQAGNVGEAIVCFGRAIEGHRRLGLTDRRLHDTLSNASAAFMKSGDYSAAEHHAREALSIIGNSEAAWTNLGLALEKQGRANEAADAFREVLDLNPGQAVATAGLKRMGLADEAAR